MDQITNFHLMNKSINLPLMLLTMIVLLGKILWTLCEFLGVFYVLKDPLSVFPANHYPIYLLNHLILPLHLLNQMGQLLLYFYYLKTLVFHLKINYEKFEIFLKVIDLSHHKDKRICYFLLPI